MSNYTNLDTIIRDFEGWETANPEDILAWLSEEVTTSKTSRYNARQLMKLLTTEVACALSNALKEAGMELVIYQLASESGIDFGDEETQRMLTIIGQQNQSFAPFVETLKNLGTYTATRWNRHCGGELPTLEQIQERVNIQKIEDVKKVSRAWFNDVLQPLVINAINNGKTIEEIKALIAGIL